MKFLKKTFYFFVIFCVISVFSRFFIDKTCDFSLKMVMSIILFAILAGLSAAFVITKQEKDKEKEKRGQN
jgi:NADH:ubiquinone oxidoreductase subunit H